MPWYMAFAAPAITGVVTGGIVVVSLRVHVEYLRAAVERNRQHIRAVDERLYRTREQLAQRIDEH